MISLPIKPDLQTGTVLLCCGCDALRDVERAFCSSCGEATDSYKYHPTAREAFAYDTMTVAEKVRTFTPVAGFQREAGSGLIYIEGEAA